MAGKTSVVGLLGAKELERGLRELFTEKEMLRKLRLSTTAAAKLVVAVAHPPPNKTVKGHYVGRYWRDGKVSRQGYMVLTPFAADQVGLRSRTGKNKTSAFSQVGIHPDAYYAVNFVDKGTKGPNGGQSANPWLSKAFDTTQPAQVDRINKYLSRAIKQRAKKIHAETKRASA